VAEPVCFEPMTLHKKIDKEGNRSRQTTQLI